MYLVSSGVLLPLHIHFYFVLILRFLLWVQGKGLMNTYWLQGHADSVSSPTRANSSRASVQSSHPLSPDQQDISGSEPTEPVHCHNTVTDNTSYGNHVDSNDIDANCEETKPVKYVFANGVKSRPVKEAWKMEVDV